LNGTFEVTYQVKAKGGALRQVKVILDVYAEINDENFLQEVELEDKHYTISSPNEKFVY